MNTMQMFNAEQLAVQYSSFAVIPVYFALLMFIRAMLPNKRK